jgi:hypothetical protein
MKRIMLTLATAALVSVPAFAQSQSAPPPPSGKDAPAMEEAPAKAQSCEMMHGSTKMEGVMIMGEDGKPTCQMKKGSMMDHSMMGHGAMMEHGEIGDEAKPHVQMDPSQGMQDKHADHKPQ